MPPCRWLGGPVTCHSNRAFAAARNHIATNMRPFKVNLRPKWRNNKSILHQFEITGTVAALRHCIVWEWGSGGGVVEAPAAARRDPLPWLVNTRPWSWNLGSSRSYIQHNHGPFILLHITLPLPKEAPRASSLPRCGRVLAVTRRRPQYHTHPPTAHGPTRLGLPLRQRPS